MKTSRLQVLDAHELERIHAASMDILASLGVGVEWETARELFRQAGADVDDDRQRVRIPESLVLWAIDQAPNQFVLYGADPAFQLEIGGDHVCFAGLGTPIHILDASGQRRPTTMDDVIRHIKLIDGCKHIHNSQMDVWPNDIPKTTIHSEAIWA